jgi:hypothetical protein
LFATHTAPWPNAIALGPSANVIVLIMVPLAGSTRRTAPLKVSAIQTEPAPRVIALRSPAGSGIRSAIEAGSDCGAATRRSSYRGEVERHPDGARFGGDRTAGLRPEPELSEDLEVLVDLRGIGIDTEQLQVADVDPDIVGCNEVASRRGKLSRPVGIGRPTEASTERSIGSIFVSVRSFTFTTQSAS